MENSNASFPSVQETEKYVDIAIGNEEDAEKCLGVSAENQDVTSGELNPDAYRDVLNRLSDNFGFNIALPPYFITIISPLYFFRFSDISDVVEEIRLEIVLRVFSIIRYNF